MRRGEFVTLVSIPHGCTHDRHDIGSHAAGDRADAAKAYGVPVYMIGYQASLIGVRIIIALVFGGNLSCAVGAMRVNQAGLVLLGLGAALLRRPSLGTIVPGIAWRGHWLRRASRPSGLHILIRFTPAHRRNVVFSLKQSGVPWVGCWPQRSCRRSR